MRKTLAMRVGLRGVWVSVMACAALLAPLGLAISSSPPSGATGSFVQGAYPAYDSSTPCSLLNSFSTPTGTNATLGTDYIQAGNGWAGMDGTPNPFTSSLTRFNTWQSPCHSGGTVDQLTLAVPIIPKQNNSPVITLEQGATNFSAYAPYFKALADDLIKYAGTTNATLRLGWEFDGTKTYSWIAQDPKHELYYATYFADIVNTMSAEEAADGVNVTGGAGFKYVWDPNWMAFYGLYHSDQGLTDNVDYVNGTAISYNGGCAAYPEANASTDTSQADSCLLYAWPGSQIQSQYQSNAQLLIGQDNYDDQGWVSGVPSGKQSDPQTGFNNYIAPALSEMEEFASLNGNEHIVFPEWGVCQVVTGYAATTYCQGDDPTYIKDMYNFMANPTNPNNPSNVVPVDWESYFNDSQLGWNSKITASYFAGSGSCFTSEFGSGSNSGC